MNKIVFSAFFWQEVLKAEPQQNFAENQPAKVLLLTNKNSAKKHSTLKLVPKKRKKVTPTPLPPKIKKILIIAPHPDDEILATADLIRQNNICFKSREKNCHSNIKVVFLTNGDAAEKNNYQKSRNYGLLRQKESKKALQKLGLTQNDWYFLEFPDSYLAELPVKNSLKSEFTGLEKTPLSATFPQLDFSRENLLKSLQNLIDKTQPTEIYFPDQSETHTDHAIIGEFFAKNWLTTAAQKFSYIVHRPRCEKEICPCNQQTDWQKLELIRFFQSQRFTPHHNKFLDQFACQKEEFRKIN